jgi:hypothetical protein
MMTVGKTVTGLVDDSVTSQLQNYRNFLAQIFMTKGVFAQGIID